MTDVVLVSMPFASAMAPSIGLSLLKAGLTRVGVECRIRYFSILFAEMLGENAYWNVTRLPESMEGGLSGREMAGEWIFAEALNGKDPGADARYVEEILRVRGAQVNTTVVNPVRQEVIDELFGARTQVDAFLDRCCDELAAERPRIVGFTSVFQQQIASLALAKRLKDRLPETYVVIGGANVEGAMGTETIRQFSFVDAAVSGEADLVFPELVKRLLDGHRRDIDLPGVRTAATLKRTDGTGVHSNAPMVIDMDALPRPDYSDYFAQFESSSFGDEWTPNIYFETSRGCWWGEIQHCTFCGLNGDGMKFRSKSGPVAVAELRDLIARYPECDIQVTDNILDLSYFKDFLPALKEQPIDVVLFYETKSNLKKEQVRMLRDAGVRLIQPGIESLSDHVLKLMRKGVSGLQNVQLLKWCREMGVVPLWNLLWGFPGETPEDYRAMEAWIPYLVHLRPPDGYQTIRLDRFSPNFFDASSLGFTNIKPLESYKHLYRSVPPEALSNLAYYFSYEYSEPRRVQDYVGGLERAVQRWKAVHDESEFVYCEDGDELLFWDSRPGVHERHTRLARLDRDVYLECDEVSDPRKIARNLHSAIEPIEESLSRLTETGYLLRDGQRYLGLAVRLGDYEPRHEALRSEIHERLAVPAEAAKSA